MHEHGGDDGQRYGDQGLGTDIRKMGELIGDTAQAQEKGLNILKGKKMMIDEDDRIGEDKHDVHKRNLLGWIFVF